MYFNSWQFVFFFVVVYFGYLILPSVRGQNVLLLVASYLFYAAWDWRFLSLIWISTAVDFCCGIAIHQSSDLKRRRQLICLSIATNLGMLALFKYFNFFAESLGSLLSLFQYDPTPLRLHIVLPVGISFYTFQTLSYTIDIYRRESQPTTSLLNFALFVAFFPQLVAGPIERASRLLPQIASRRHLDQNSFFTGCWLVYWGMWKKIVVADNLAYVVDRVFDNSVHVTVIPVYIGLIAFAFQIYCDFSGYSDIARGVSRMMGFEIMRNFNLPYFAVNPSDFWKRWHLSLSTWLRDYLYIPLGGNRGSRTDVNRNLMVTMLLGGLWHGASWNFLWWGLYHGLLLVGFRLWRETSLGRPREQGALTKALQMIGMFQLTLFGWLLFRANRSTTDSAGITHDESTEQILELLTSFTNGTGMTSDTLNMFVSVLWFAAPFCAIQILQFKTRDHYFMWKWGKSAQVLFIAFLTWMWLIFGVQDGGSFIYFQF